MKYLLLPFLLLALGFSAALPAQVTKIKDAGPDDKRINFTILGDGYQSAEETDFDADVNSAITDFFNEPPFTNYTNFFNVHSIFVASPESGADHPSDHLGDSHPELYVNTAFDAQFHWGGSFHRLLYASGAKVNTAVAANYPASDHELLIVNTPYYGGGGGSFAVFSTHGSASDLAIHEAGHSFMNLGDEYNASNSERANVTNQSNAGNVRWKDWIGINGVGEFARNTTTFKPVDGECMMEFLSRGFCSVCQEQTVETIYNTISPLETTTPATTDVNFTGDNLDFSITTIKPIPNTLTYVWELDGTQVAVGTEDITLTAAQLEKAEHTLLVRVTDETSLSMKNANYVFTYEWTISKASLPLEWVAFTARSAGKENQLDWTIAEPEGSSHFTVERSPDGLEWDNLGRVPFTGASDYRFYDDFPLPGSNFYRIRAIDFDGTITPSPVREVSTISRHYFKVGPSVTDGPVAIEVFSQEASAEVQVVDANGQLLSQRTLGTQAGWKRTRLELGSLPAGTYFVRVLAGKELHTQKVIRR